MTMPGTSLLSAAVMLATAAALSMAANRDVASPTPTSTPTSTTQPIVAPVITAAPAPGETVRVGGDRTARISGTDGNFRAGVCNIDTPLPTGYPPPTPPQAIDLKTYPAVRAARVNGAGNPDSGKNETFWPLFNHIKKHEIAMTSPVEMNYSNLTSAPGSAPDAWSMSFLYREPDMNQPGQEGAVIVEDTAPLTVISLGMKGDYSMKTMREGMQQIESWLTENPHWQPAGEWRTLYYNGPALFFWNKWAEVQLPVKPTE
ncbi:MAG TPA: heme-binding protein [Tepidisphaeraceae bacterium]|nr:heme-binding protein [Tepidisphaeraceae bacterium]